MLKHKRRGFSFRLAAGTGLADQLNLQEHIPDDQHLPETGCSDPLGGAGPGSQEQPDLGSRGDYPLFRSATCSPQAPTDRNLYPGLHVLSYVSTALVKGVKSGGMAMNHQENLQPDLRRQAEKELRGLLTAAEREALLIKCWMSHDARWFTAVAAEFGLEVANRINKIAAHELGEAESKRLAAALQRPAIKELDDFLIFQEMAIALLGPDLLQYEISKIDDSAYQMPVSRCFAYENVCRAGVVDSYQCGILPRVTGWFEGLGIDYELDPVPAKCLKAQGKECTYTVTLRVGET
jgi:hypothetical protein